jgi:hypothetical protein
MYTTSIKQYEKYCLRLLLLKIPGCQSFDDLKTYNGYVYDNFEDAAIARGLVNSDQHIHKALDEGAFTRMPKQFRLLFATLLIYCRPSNPNGLFEKYLEFMIDDYTTIYSNEVSKDLVLHDLSKYFTKENTNLRAFNLPTPQDLTHLLPNVDLNNQTEMTKIADYNIKMFNTEQLSVFTQVIASIYNNTKQKLFYVDGPGGTGKTFLYNTIINYISGKADTIVSTATTGIASTLLLGANTYHSTFKLFPPINSESVCNIKPNSEAANYIINAKLILIDEITMATNHALNAINRCCKDLLNNDMPYGGKTILIGGDFRQCLPVIRKGNKTKILSSVVKNIPEWSLFQKLRLKQNMRTINDTDNYAEWLLKLGNGSIPNDNTLPEDNIIIPDGMLLQKGHNLITEVFGNSFVNNDSTVYTKAAILCTTNDDCQIINNKINDSISGNVYYNI